MTTITSIEALEAIYGQPRESAVVKVTDHITAHYRAYIERAPFATLATVGPEGLDCSPRGDLPGFVAVLDPRTLALPDRRGNNRVDSLRNIVRDPRVALMFLIPGSGNAIRVNGTAVVSVEPALLERFAVAGKAPRSVVVVSVREAYFQCARAILRAGLWDPERQVEARALPSAGQMLAALSDARLGGADYDRDWPQRAAETLW